MAKARIRRVLTGDVLGLRNSKEVIVNEVVTIINQVVEKMPSPDSITIEVTAEAIIWKGETMRPIYLENWKNKKDMMGDFEITEETLRGCKILLAFYGYGDYDGDAFVLFMKGKKLYEVNGSHCSCFGLEGQWSPEETNKTALRHRVKEGGLGRNDYTSGGEFADKLLKVLDRL